MTFSSAAPSRSGLFRGRCLFFESGPIAKVSVCGGEEKAWKPKKSSILITATVSEGKERERAQPAISSPHPIPPKIIKIP